jgi:hypothetical protein
MKGLRKVTKYLRIAFGPRIPAVALKYSLNACNRFLQNYVRSLSRKGPGASVDGGNMLGPGVECTPPAVDTEQGMSCADERRLQLSTATRPVQSDVTVTRLCK